VGCDGQQEGDGAAAKAAAAVEEAGDCLYCSDLERRCREL